MAKQVSLSDEVIARLDRMKRDRSYSEVILDLLRNQPKTEQDRLNNAFSDLRSLVSGIFGDEMTEPVEMMRVILIRCHRYRNDEKLLSEQISTLSSALQGALEEIYRLGDQES